MSLLIAEVACGHEGNQAYLLRLAQAIREAGADAVKFQAFSAQEVVAREHPEFSYYSRITFSAETWREIIEACAGMGLKVWVDVSGPLSLHVIDLARGLVSGVKIHSADVDHPAVIEGIRGLGLPIAIGCGGMPLIDLFELLDLLGPGRDTILMHGYQAFPQRLDEPGAPPVRGIRAEDLQLWKIRRLAETFPQARIGLSDHLAGDDPLAIQVPAIAVALGASVIEKHVTISRAERRTDYYSALEPEEFRRMAQALREAESALGAERLELAEAERAYQREMKRTVIAASSLSEGQVIGSADLRLIRDGNYHGSARAGRAIGRSARGPVAGGTWMTEGLLQQKVGVFCNARLASSRLPRKALLPFFQEHTALGYLLKRLVSYPGRLGQVVLATTTLAEDEVLARVAEGVGVPCIRGEPDDVMGRMVQTADACGWDVLVRVTGDDLLVSGEYIERALSYHLAHSLDYTRIRGLPNGLECEVIDVRTLRRIHQAVVNRQQTEQLTWYLDSAWVCRNGVLEAEPAHRYPQFRLTLDYREDYELMREVARRCHAAQAAFYLPVDRVIRTLIELNPVWLNRESLGTLRRGEVDTRLVYRPVPVTPRGGKAPAAHPAEGHLVAT